VNDRLFCFGHVLDGSCATNRFFLQIPIGCGQDYLFLLKSYRNWVMNMIDLQELIGDLMTNSNLCYQI
jgi:hypothetical protein